MILIESLNVKTLNSIKKIHNYPDAVYILTFILAVDIGLTFAFGENILTFDWGQLNFGIVITFFVIYIVGAFLANIVLACLLYVLLLFFGSKVDKVKKFFNDKDYSVNDKNYKSISKLYDEALKEENDFKLKIISEHKMQYEKKFVEKKKFLSITFKFICLVIFDRYFTEKKSIMDFMLSQLSPLWSGLVLISFLVLVFVWVSEIFESNDDEYRIKWPQMNDRKIEEAKKTLY